MYGLAYDRMAAGDWPAARTLLARALALKKQDGNYEAALAVARLATGEGTEVERETRDLLTHDRTNLLLTARLVNALAAQGDRRPEILQVCNSFNDANAKRDDEGKAATASVRRHALYVLGDLAAVEKMLAGNSPAEKIARADELIEQGHLAEAVKLLPAPDNDENLLVEELVLAVAWRKAGNDVEANHWASFARKILAAGNEDYVQAAAWLGESAAPNAITAQDVALPPRLKAIILVAVIARHPESRAELAPRTRRLNVERVFPFQFVQSATAAAP